MRWSVIVAFLGHALFLKYLLSHAPVEHGPLTKRIWYGVGSGVVNVV